jgi:hypothetical protein
MRQILLKSVGTRLTEVLELEMEQIEINEQRKRGVIRAHDRMWQSFVDSIRQNLTSSPDVSAEVEALVSEWAKKRISTVAPAGGERAAA